MQIETPLGEINLYTDDIGYLKLSKCVEPVLLCLDFNTCDYALWEMEVLLQGLPEGVTVGLLGLKGSQYEVAKQIETLLQYTSKVVVLGGDYIEVGGVKLGCGGCQGIVRSNICNTCRVYKEICQYTESRETNEGK